MGGKTIRDMVADAGDMTLIILHNPHRSCPYTKITGRRVMIHKTLMIQFEKHTKTQVIHENIPQGDLCSRLEGFLEDGGYRKILIRTETGEYDGTIDDQRGLRYKKKVILPTTGIDTAHNRIKRYPITEGIPVEPLIDLGIFTNEGKIVQAKYDKFKQINRFLELIHDVLYRFPDKKINILDFGCGKSYLTFMVYYYLKEMLHYDIQITGLDLKEAVVAHCTDLALRYGYTSLRFETGSIENFVPSTDIDLVMSLHACDTATDWVLFKAIHHKARVILSVPCCHHEANAQIESPEFPILTRYGIVQERLAALFTDTIRANILTALGYKTQILEFVDMDTTPKNLLIRAVQSAIPPESRRKAREELLSLIGSFHLVPRLYRLVEADLDKAAGE